MLPRAIVHFWNNLLKVEMSNLLVWNKGINRYSMVQSKWNNGTDVQCPVKSKPWNERYGYKLQALVYKVVPPTTATIGYALVSSWCVFVVDVRIAVCL